MDERIANEQTGLTKRELLELTRARDKLERALGGIKEMGGLPDILFIIDTNKEAIAVAEANTLHLPVVAILDSNSSPDDIAYPIPGNDDAMRAIHLYCDLVSGAVLDGLAGRARRFGRRHRRPRRARRPGRDEAARRGARGKRRATRAPDDMARLRCRRRTANRQRANRPRPKPETRRGSHGPRLLPGGEGRNDYGRLRAATI